MAIPLSPGSDPILTRESELLGALIDAKIAAANPVTLARVYIGCDGLQHVQLPNAVSCCPTCETAPGALVPVYTGNGSGPLTGSIPYIHSSSAGQPTIVGGSSYRPAPTVLPRRYLDSVGNLWSDTGWISAGNTPAASLMSYEYQVVYPVPPPETPPDTSKITGTNIKRVTSPTVGSTVMLIAGLPSAGPDTAAHIGTDPAVWYFPAVGGVNYDGAATGLGPNVGVVLSIEWGINAGPGYGLKSPPYAVIRDATTLALLTASPIPGVTGTSAYSVQAAPDGTWIAHALPTSGQVATAFAMTIHRFAYSGSVSTYIGTFLLTNDHTAPRTNWVAGSFIRQVQ